MRTRVVPFLKKLREEIIASFQTLESEANFQRDPWDYHAGEGGGEIGLIRGGKAFEKAAVNFSEVSGTTFPGSDGKGPFFATGVSLITHMQNPHSPTVHFNIRYIETPEKSWFGGGYDLTPMGFSYEEDTQHFHEVAKESLDQIDPVLYPEFSQNAKEYFYIPHRKKERGVGGIFFDHYFTGDWDKDFLMWETVGTTFLDAIMPIYEKRIHVPYSQSEKEVQWKLRGHYAEFNLAYDRGTKFGFLSGGNPEAILCSMPPVATW
ncbi:MAG: Oxygen-dependent coproporphyrinogen-III oxidase [Chlamydiae bacterium]|nr:Oxygen-dependent coproporphyrinogen-III oxidase [Chlamydiota bacterium]